MSPSLTGKVCLVTGAGRGIGRGIALQLGRAGATVYITGRTKANLEEVATEIKARRGNPIIVQLDHSTDEDVESLFQRIAIEQSGQLDVLVNNAYAGVNNIFQSAGKMFYETDPTETWDCINGVGLRGHYHCTVLASRLMVPRGEGLIVNISSGGGLKYLLNVAYGVGKAACDRMAADCGHELRSSNVAMISLWPGAVKTEFVQDNLINSDTEITNKKIFEEGETVDFTGKAVAHLAADKDIMKKTGKILRTMDLSYEYGFTEDDGSTPKDLWQLNNLMELQGRTWLAYFVPNFISIPKWIIHMMSYKF